MVDVCEEACEGISKFEWPVCNLGNEFLKLFMILIDVAISNAYVLYRLKTIKF